jgi:Tyrosine phosphatase family
VDLLPSRLKFQIFVDMPWRIRLATIAAPLKVSRCIAPAQHCRAAAWHAARAMQAQHSLQYWQQSWLAVFCLWSWVLLAVLLQGKSPQEVMTPAVADPAKLGYLKLYKMMLDMVRMSDLQLSAPLSKWSTSLAVIMPYASHEIAGDNSTHVDALQSMRQIARALRIFAYEENLPIMVHCIHGELLRCSSVMIACQSVDVLMCKLKSRSYCCAGCKFYLCKNLVWTAWSLYTGKDRTGLIIALLLLTLGVPEEVVVLDYAKSEVELKVCTTCWFILALPAERHRDRPLQRPAEGVCAGHQPSNLLQMVTQRCEM